MSSLQIIELLAKPLGWQGCLFPDVDRGGLENKILWLSSCLPSHVIQQLLCLASNWPSPPLARHAQFHPRMYSLLRDVWSCDYHFFTYDDGLATGRGY
jgi:hypothetical protein